LSIGYLLSSVLLKVASLNLRNFIDEQAPHSLNQTKKLFSCGKTGLSAFFQIETWR